MNVNVKFLLFLIKLYMFAVRSVSKNFDNLLFSIDNLYFVIIVD